MNIHDYDNQQQNNQILKCPNCGQDVGDWVFCFYCGTKLNAQSDAELSNGVVETSESTTDNTSDNTIEYLQEEIKAPVCPNCGKEIGEWDFCFHCGTNLKAQSVVEQSNEEDENPESTTYNPEDTVEDQRETAEVNVPSCPNCGKEIGEWDFCFYCGTNLKSEPLSEVSEGNNAELIKETALVMVEDPERKGNNSPDVSETTKNEPELTGNNNNIIILEDENGNELEYIFLDLIQYRNKEYVVLLPNDDSVELVTILQFEEAPDGTEHYSSVENDFTLQVVFEIFKERAKNDFNFID